jgi:hypothetical protein
VTGTSNLFAADNASASSSPINNNVYPISYGNIFEVTATTTLSQVIAGFSTTTNVNFSISLYAMTDELTVEETPLFTQTASKNAAGFHFFTVPATEMVPGRYFLCVNQLTVTSLGLQHDGNTSRSVYKIGDNQTLTYMNAQLNGAAALRMVTEVENCATPTNLAVLPKYSTALFSWEGDAIKYQLILNDGNDDFSYFTTDKSLNVTGLSLATNYTWSVTALCDAVHHETATGAPFSTMECHTINDLPFKEDFDAIGTTLPACWTNERITGTTNWTVVTGSTGLPATAHSGTHKLRFFGASKGHSARLTTPALDLTSLETPTLTFWHTQQVWDGDQDTLKIYYKTSENGEWIDLKTYSDDISNWQKDQIELPEVSDDYYISFVAISQRGRGIQIDDILIGNIDDSTDGNDLLNLTTYPYSQVPVSQTLPHGIVKNQGFATQTNILLTAEINGTAVGASEPLASLGVGETAILELSPAVNIPLGDNMMTYAVSQDQTDDTPEDNICTFTFKGTQSIFAIDDVVVCENGAGSSAYTLGHVFTITQPSTLSQVMIGHGNGAYLEYSISLYAMESELSTAVTPLFTQEAVRKSTGFNIITVPATPLLPGNYYLCVNQVADANISISYDNNLDKKTYVRGSNGNLFEPAIKVGAMAIRMILEVTDCITEQPTNLTVVSGYTTAVFSWEGTTPLYYLMTLNDGNQDYLFETQNNSITVSELPLGASYTWKVAAMCDAMNGVETEGEPFTTLTCDVITQFPYEESFENHNAEFPPCWIQERETGAAHWYVAEEGDGVPASTYEGNFKARFYTSVQGTTTKLITPSFDLSGVTHPVLEFWHTQREWLNNQDTLKIYYKTSVNDAWTHLVTYDTNIKEWQKAHLELPNSSEDYYIAFEAISRNGYGIQIDNVKVIDFSNFVDGEIAQIVAPKSGINYELTNNENVTVIIMNNGDTLLTNFNLILELNGVEVATETFTNSIESLEQATYTFTATLDLSQEAEYEITVTAIVEDDKILENNSKTITLRNVICNTVTELPFAEGFEGELFPPLCWSSVNIGDKTWERNTGKRYSGEASACHNFGTSMQESWLITPQIETTASKELVLEFWSMNDWKDDNVYNGVWISTTGNDPETSNFVELKQLRFSEISAYWQKIEIPLSDYAGENIYIGFKYEGSYGDNWYIDDILIYDIEGEPNGYTVTDVEPSFTLYPNPVTDVLNLVRASDEKVRIHIYNSMGSLVQSFETFEAQTAINVSTLPAGVYMIRVVGTETHSGRFIKK